MIQEVDIFGDKKWFSNTFFDLLLCANFCISTPMIMIILVVLLFGRLDPFIQHCTVWLIGVVWDGWVVAKHQL